MKKITLAEFVEILKSLKGATIATLTLSTEPTMNKKGNPFVGLVRKIASHSVILNYSYENSVNKQREREENFDDSPFVAQETWGTHITPSLIENNGQLYVQAKVQKRLNETYVNQLDGTIVDKAELAPFMPEKKKSQTQLVEKDIINIRPKITNIIGANLLGEKYEIVG